MIQAKSLAFILLALALMLPACNTIEGIGEDLEAAGSATSKAARDYNPEKTNEIPEGQNPYK